MIQFQEMGGEGPSGMERFAEMAASGKHPQNLFRAMQHALGYPAGAPEMDLV